MNKLSSLHPHTFTGLCLFTKFSLGKTPGYFQELLTVHKPNHSLKSSDLINLLIPKACTSFGCFSFQFPAADNWIRLQQILNLEPFISLACFKGSIYSTAQKSLCPFPPCFQFYIMFNYPLCNLCHNLVLSLISDILCCIAAS